MAVHTSATNVISKKKKNREQPAQDNKDCDLEYHAPTEQKANTDLKDSMTEMTVYNHQQWQINP